MAGIEIRIHIAASRERCFDLARSVELHLCSASPTGEHAIAGRSSGLLELHDEVTWRARHFRVWQNLTSRITAFERPAHFRDSMVRGAFARFDQDHYFIADDNGGTVMHDVFDYTAPMGPLGWLVEQVFLTRYMRRFLEARNRDVKAVAESDAWRRFLPPVKEGTEMSEEWSVVRNCMWIQEAMVVKSMLEASGIEVLVPDEHTLGLQPHYGIALGGARVLVRSVDLSQATALLDEMETAVEVEEINPEDSDEGVHS